MIQEQIKDKMMALQSDIDREQRRRSGKISVIRNAKKEINKLQSQLNKIAMENIIKTVSQSAEFVPLKVSVHADHLKRIHALAEEFNLSLDEIATALFYERMEQAGKQWKS